MKKIFTGLICSTFIFSLVLPMSLHASGFEAEIEAEIERNEILDESIYNPHFKYVPDSSPIPFNQCFEAANRRFKVGKALLLAIAKQESDFNPKAVGFASKGKYRDIGIMQINTWWIPRLRELFGIEVTEQDLFKPCTNIYIGALLLSKKMEWHNGYWRGVGYYNAWNYKKRQYYISLIRTRLEWVNKNYMSYDES